MIDRILQFKQIVQVLTTYPEKIVGLSLSNINKVGSLHLSENDWENLSILKKNLEPFYSATTMLSGRKYATLSISFGIKKVLINFYKRQCDNYNEDCLRKVILDKLTFYFDQSTMKEKKLCLVKE